MGARALAAVGPTVRRALYAAPMVPRLNEKVASMCGVERGSMQPTLNPYGDSIYDSVNLPKLSPRYCSLHLRDVLDLRSGIHPPVSWTSQASRELSGTPDNHRRQEVHKTNAMLYWRLEKFEKAAAFAERVELSSPEGEGLGVLLHDCYTKTGNTQKAQALRQKMRERPGEIDDDWELQAALEVCAAKEQGNHAEVVSVARSYLMMAEILQKKDLLCFLHTSISHACVKLGRHSEAAKAICEASEHNLQTSDAELLILVNGIAEATEAGDHAALKKLTALGRERSPSPAQLELMYTEPKLLVAFYKVQAQALSTLNKDDEALSILRKAEIVDPKDADVYAQLSNILHELEEHEEALKAQERLVELEPENERAQIVLASRLKQVLKAKTGE